MRLRELRICPSFDASGFLLHQVMIDPWQLLILDANTATEKDVKAAYARMLKQHRPDTDPEGFRRVREAYELALGEIRERDARGEPPPGYAQEAHEDRKTDPAAAADPIMASVSFTLPDTVQSSFSEVERAAASGNVEQLEAALQEFEEQCESAQVDSAARVRALEQACAGNMKLLSAAVPDQMLLRLATKGEVNLPHLVLSAWVEEERHARIVQLGGAILDHARGLATPEGGVFMARVGVMVGLEKPGMASSLGNLAYPHLPVDARTQFMGQLEHEAALGAAFEDVTPEMKPFWFERLRHAAEPHDWRDANSLRALDDLINRSRYTWQGWGIVKQLLPPEHWAQVENRLRNQAQQVTQSTPRASKIPGWMVVPFVVVVLNVLRFLGSESSTPPSPVRSYEKYSGFQQKQLTDFKKNDELSKALRKSADGIMGVNELPSFGNGHPWDRLPIPEITVPEPLRAPPAPTNGKPSLPASKTDGKAHEDYLRALQNGSLFDGGTKTRPPP
jgi:hypothetical protein